MTIDELRNSGTILFECLCGSRAYNINTPTSDFDFKGVYLAPLSDLLKDNYQPQISDPSNDTTFYELRRYLELLGKQGPDVLEMMFMPDECIIYKDPVMDIIFNRKEEFLTKTCMWSFGNYAISQIKKATGLNKKINTPEMAIRKTPLDFCYFMHNGKSIDAKSFLEFRGMNQSNVGLVSLAHMRFTYAAYYDMNKIYKGIIQSEELSNDISTSSVEKGVMAFGYLQFNKDAYEVHCRLHLEYMTWVEKRNPERYKVNMTLNGEYDCKNMCHCIRLIRVAQEIATEGRINVKRADREHLLDIRNGKVKLDDLMAEADISLSTIGELYDRSTLKEKVDYELLTELLFQIRKEKYGLNEKYDC